jgi:hypothetical protein
VEKQPDNKEGSEVKDSALAGFIPAKEPKANVTRLFDDLAIRDAVVHYPDDMMWVNGLKAKKLVFGVINDLDQNVSVQPIGRAGAAKGNLGSATTVNKNSEGLVPLDILVTYWAPWLSVSITAASGPSSGKITIYAIWAED